MAESTLWLRQLEGMVAVEGPKHKSMDFGRAVEQCMGLLPEKKP